MTATTMHFGPEWMRKAPARANPSPPLASPAPTGASTYSALVAPALQMPPEKPDPANPFRYSKEDMIRIYKDGGGKGGLGLEVERYDGITREVGTDPIGLKEMSEAERRIFAGPLNSEMRRRPSTADFAPLSTPGLGERPKLGLTNTNGPASPMRERLGGFMGRRRDSTDSPSLTLPRKLSQSSLQAPLASPRDALPSPRRMGSGFDGVLSDSWSSRRRTTEGALKLNGRSGEPGDSGDTPKAGGIKEEEEGNGTSQMEANASNAGLSDSHPGLSMDGRLVNRSGTAQGPGDIAGGIGNLSLETHAQKLDSSPMAPPAHTDSGPPGPPPGIVDPATSEWTYLDPQGQVQGPFPALTMQQWYDDGYFTLNLLMKRVNVDTEWTSVGGLLQRAGNPRIFVSPLPPAVSHPPPRRDPVLDGAIQDGSFGSPFQPVPTRSLRTSTLDNYLHNGTTVPDSPSSSLSVGRFSNDSPDPNAFGNRLGNMFNSSPVGSRLGFASVQSNGLEPQRRSTFDTMIDPLLSRQGYSTYSQRTGSTDGLGFEAVNPFPPGQSSAYIASNASQASLTDKSDDFSNGRGFAAHTVPGNQSPFNNNEVGSGLREGPRLLKRELFERGDSQPNIQTSFANGNFGYPSTSQQPFGHNQPVPYSQDPRPIQQNPIPSTSDRPHAVGLTHQTSFISSPGHSPWPVQDGLAPRRPGPFDPNYPTSRNTVAVKPPPVIQPLPPQPQPALPAALSSNHSPWFVASQTAAGDGWGVDPNSLTAANLGQHNKQQEQQDLQKVQLGEKMEKGKVLKEEVPAQPEATHISQPKPEVTNSVPVETPTPVSKSRRKPTAPAVAQASPSKPAAAAEPSLPRPPSPIPAPADPKSPWTIEEEKKPLSLREIQELELKKAEARKAAERERTTRAATATSPSAPAEDVQTISWGLPTSQAGSRPAKEAPASVPAGSSPAGSPALPVWVNAAKAPAVKKTMKEIQEEEEKRKKVAAKEKETVAAAARRAYAETTTKAPVTAPSGGAWTTVGSSGKSNLTVPARPAITTSPSTVKPVASPTTVALSAASVARSPAISTPTRSPVVTAAMKLAPSASKEEAPTPPSHDFLKWMAEALKGLNSTVNLEEITSMLLTFPMDPDPSTVEVISDLIYSNSTTLDGRRFAAEFVSKRKADQKGSAVGSSGKTLSIADVVKTQPKPAQNEWGGFKVVNKKKKGARA